MAVNTIPYIPKDGQIDLEDGDSPATSMTLEYEDGDLTIGPLRQSNMSVQHFRDRGIFYSSRSVQEELVDFSFTAHATELSDGTEKLLPDICRCTGAWASGVSQLNSDVWAFKMTFTADTSGITGGDSGTIVLDYCVGEYTFSEGVPGKFSVSGQATLVSSAGVTVT